jgi:pyridoxal phosphate enzyme (YggS family)
MALPSMKSPMDSCRFISVRENIQSVQDRIASAAKRVGRDVGSIELVAISKTKPVSLIVEAIDAGITDIGENRVQEAKSKHTQVDRPARWHLVGHLQTNKVKQALQIFDLIHSVDSIRLLTEINRRSCQLNRQTDVLVEVNTSGEESKYGLQPNQLLSFMQSTLEYPHVRIKGLMTIGRFVPEPEEVRLSFTLLRRLQEKIDNQGYPNIQMKYLSMGMTNDFEVAIEEGANMVRIGSAIFGERT